MKDAKLNNDTAVMALVTHRSQPLALTVTPGQPEDPQTPLTEGERDDLAKYEGAVDAASLSLRESGDALRSIRDRRLYREQANTLEAYCRLRWGFARSTVYQRIDAFEAYEVLSAVADIPASTSEFQLRALAGLNPDQMVRVWKEAANSAPNGKLSAKHIKATRIELGLSKPRNPARKVSGLTRLIEFLSLLAAERCGDPEMLWTQQQGNLE